MLSKATQSQGGDRMRLHANAALSWSGRRLLCERVLVKGWTLTAAAEAAGSACAVLGSGSAAIGTRASRACLIAPRRRIVWPIALLPIGWP